MLRRQKYSHVRWQGNLILTLTTHDHEAAAAATAAAAVSIPVMHCQTQIKLRSWAVASDGIKPLKPSRNCDEAGMRGSYQELARNSILVRWRARSRVCTRSVFSLLGISSEFLFSSRSLLSSLTIQTKQVKPCERCDASKSLERNEVNTRS